MAELLNNDTSELITGFINLESKQELTRITQKTLDGRHYIQRIGSPAIIYTVIAYVTPQGKTKLMQAEDTGELLKATVNSGIYFGRIIDLSDFEKLTSGYYKVTISLAKEVET